MPVKTLTRADLAEAVYRKVGLSRTESGQLVEEVLDEICDAIVRGELVKLSSFAIFQVRQKQQRIGRNPKTGEEAPILPRRVVTFKASKVLKERMLRTHQHNSKSRAKSFAVAREAQAAAKSRPRRARVKVLDPANL